MSMLLLVDDTKPRRPRREPPDVPWRAIAWATTSIGLGIGSGVVDGLASYGLLLGAVTAAGLGFRGGPGIPWSGLRDHRQ
jgi:hypothetical protein